jgi:hypothetical protein
MDADAFRAVIATVAAIFAIFAVVFMLAMMTRMKQLKNEIRTLGTRQRQRGKPRSKAPKPTKAKLRATPR